MGGRLGLRPPWCAEGSHKYAARMAKHAHAVWRHAKALIEIHIQIQTEAVALAGPDYALFHGRLALEPYVSIAEQSNSDEWGRHVLGAGLIDIYNAAGLIIDIYNAAGFMAEDAGQVASVRRAA